MVNKKVITILLMLLISVQTVSAINVNNNQNEKDAGEDIIEPLSAGNGHCALVVVGGSGESCHIRTAERVIAVYQNAGYNVKYLETVRDSDVEDAITNWIPNNLRNNGKVAMAFIDHGSTSGFDLGRNLMTPDELASWVDQIDGLYSNCMIYIGACYAGVFIDELSGSNRIIITSTGPMTVSYKDPGNEQYFTKEMYIALAEGASYGKAWERADAYIDSPPFSIIFAQQNPKIDDNGDTRGTGDFRVNTLPMNGDGNLALDTYVAGSGIYKPKEKEPMNYLSVIRLLGNFIRNKAAFID